MSIEVRILRHGDEAVLNRVESEVFGHAIDSQVTMEFLTDPRLHLAVAIEAGEVVGFASGVHYIHPDKPTPELWINEWV
jgi:hypothetical protein